MGSAAATPVNIGNCKLGRVDKDIPLILLKSTMEKGEIELKFSSAKNFIRNEILLNIS